MPIPVTCPGCHKRFNVSDQFAGKKGPCPDCKTVISIPEKENEVVIHAPEEFGPKGASGQSVLKPIEREETKFSTIAIVTGAALAILIPVIALVFRFTLPLDQDVMLRQMILGVGALLIAPPLVLVGYTFLRDDELEGYEGQALLWRVAICSLAYAILWAVYLYVIRMMGFEAAPEIPHLIYLIPLLAIPGAVAAVATLDLEPFLATVHYGFYLSTCIVVRMIMGLGPF